jgi:DNA-binding MarR family transcriptional regulator
MLDREGRSLLEWVVLNIVSTTPRVPAGDVFAQLSQELSIDVSDVDRVVAELLSSHRLATIDVDEVACLELSPEGRGYHQRLRQTVDRASAELRGVFDPTDIATTVKVLTAVRERAPSIATA